jgi:fructoselysine 6-phosphate deglycase
MSEEHEVLLRKALGAVRELKPANIYLAACGGSAAYLMHHQYLIDTETDIPSFVYNSAEFIHRAPKGLGKDSLVILCSHSGNTSETVEAAKFARARGALTVAYSNKDASPLTEAAQYSLLYDWGPEASGYENKSGMGMRFTFGLLDALRPDPKYRRVLETCKNLTAIFDRNTAKFAPQAAEWGASHKRENIIYTLGSGQLWGETYSFAVCLLQEMLWVNSAGIHSGEYFHGPFEITDFDVPFLVFESNDDARPIDERAIKFVKQHSDKVTIIDAEKFDWTGVDSDIQRYFCAPVMGAVARTFADALADHRGHPLSVRRYMWRMEY